MMISSPGVPPSLHSGLILSPHADTGNLRANVYPARPLFLDPADNLRSDLTETDHAALSSRIGMVAGPGFIHAYPVPPVIINLVVLP